MNEINLEKLYSPSQWSKRASPDEVIKLHNDVMAENSAKARSSCAYFQLKYAYENDEQRIDIYYQKSNTADKLDFNDKKIFIYLHGGYWQWGSVDFSAFMAENFTSKNVVVAAIGYRLGPNATMHEIWDDVEKGMLKLASVSGNAEFYVCGHSAGAHLAAMLLYSKKIDLTRFRALFLVSGVFDIQPIVNTSINDNLKMNLNDAADLSPLLHEKNLHNKLSCNERKHLKILLVVAENDSIAFKQQSTDYYDELLKSNFKSVEIIEISNTDHFNLMDTIYDDKFQLTQEIYKFLDV